MRKLGKICVAFALAAGLNAGTQQASAQVIGNQVYEPGSFRQVASDVNLGLPGRVWFRSTYADQGLGYQGAYLTLGGKRRMFQDSWNGRWLSEGRFHYSLEEGGFFANLGIERVFSIEAAGADLVAGFWYDYDGDEQGSFAHTFNQVSVNAAIKTKRWDLVGNGYFPVGTTDFDTELGGDNAFLGSSILLTPGIDSALRGFDATLRTRPKALAFANGSVDIGGYGYSSDLVDFFGGGRVRVGFQARNGLAISAEVNHDDRFNTTGALSLAWSFGAVGSASGGGGLGLGNDLNETIRNDHIVRYNQEFVLAIDPDTGVPYNVIHVDSDMETPGSGTFESPFATLAEAEAASAAGDIIFLNNGSLDLDSGIVLQERQQLFGAGSDHLIPIQNGEFFQLNATGTTPTLTNPGGNAVVELAGNNTIRGVNIDATGATFGIFGDGIDSATIEGTTVTGASDSGVAIQNFTGDVAVRNSTFNNNGIDGLFLVNGLDNQSVITFEGNTASGNVFEGLHVENFRGTQLVFDGNTTNNNSRHGLFVEQFVGAGLDFDLFNHTSTDNTANGILIQNGDGDLDIRDAIVTDNAFNGLEIINWTNMNEGDSTRITGTASTIADNQNNNLAITIDRNNAVQDVLVTGQTVTGGQRGIFASASGQNSVLNISVLDNVEFSEHLSEGLRFEADNSATLNVLVENTDATTPLLINDNGLAAGAGIGFFADGPTGAAESRINAEVRNVSINNDGELGFASPVISPFANTGVAVQGTGTSRVNLLLEDSRIESANGVGVSLDNDGAGDVNNIFLRNLVIRADSGITIDTSPGSFLDFELSGSDLQSNGLVRSIADGGSEDDPTESGDPFTDTAGFTGITINLTGDANPVLDNFTRLTIVDNLIRDYTFEAITIDTFGDAQLLSNISSNQILRNGPGFDQLLENPDDPMTFTPFSTVVADDEFPFFTAVRVTANDNSLISLRFDGNSLLNNYDPGLELNTFGTATINASINNNVFANDIGEDSDFPAFTFSFQTDFTVNNNDLGTMCLDLSTNSFLSNPFFNSPSGNPLRLELDGATNGFTAADLALAPGIVTGSTGICDGLIEAEELFFEATGASSVDSDTPPGGGFSTIDRD